MQNYKITTEIKNGYFIDEYPEQIDGYFDCSNTQLKSLKGCPKKIGKSFYCDSTLITTLQDGPQWVGKDYICAATPITSLEGAPQYVGEEFWCIENNISSLQGIGRKFLKEINNFINLSDCPIKSHMLGILLIKNLKYFRFNTNKQLEEIFKRHLKGDRDVLECQEELINNGFKDYAKL